MTKTLSLQKGNFLFVAASVLICCFSGYLIEPSQNGIMQNDRSLRAITVFAVFLFSITSYIAYKKKAKPSRVPLTILAATFYGIFISAVNDRAFDSLSYALRLISLALIIEISYTQALSRHTWQLSISRTLTLMLAIYCLQVIFDQLTGRVSLLNGAYRHSASIGSPIGFASTIAAILIGTLYLWLKTQKKIYLVLSIIALACILSTATRSISILSMFLIWTAFTIRKGVSHKIVILVATPIIALLAISFSPSDSGVLERIKSTSIDGSLDNSSLFRLFILDTYLSKIDTRSFILGLGLGSFPAWFYQKTGIAGVAPHFEWLWILSEFGVIAFTAYIAAIIKATISLFRKFSKSPPTLFVGICAITAHQTLFQFSNPLYFYQAFIPFALICGVYLAETHRPSRAHEKTNNQNQLPVSNEQHIPTINNISKPALIPYSKKKP